MALNVNPTRVGIGDPIAVQLSGLAPEAQATLVVEATDQFGNTWRSAATYAADAQGEIDIARVAPLSGSYEGADPAGPFWSMTCVPVGEMMSPFPILKSYTVAALVNDATVATQTVERFASHDVARLEVSGDVVGAYFVPAELREPGPALIVLGGSEGGFNAAWAEVVASQTRLPVLALAYFGAPGLPPTLQNIPLETIEQGIAWLEQQPQVTPGRIGMVGASRGGELAMLSASLFPQVKAVVGYTPSGVMWEGIGEGDTPSWTWRGQPLPYLHYIDDPAIDAEFAKAKAEGTPFFDAPSFELALDRQQDRIADATIPVEQSQAAFLLIGNPGDGVWPSDRLSQIAIDRLRAHNHPRRYELLSYEGGGHMLVPYPYYPTTMRQFYLPTVGVWEGLGGTAAGAAHAASDSWPRVKEFLKQEL